MIIKNLLNFIFRKKIDIAIAIIAIAMGSYLVWKIEDIIVFAIFIWIIMNPVSSRYLAYFTIIFFVVCPILLILKNGDWAETVAVYAYYSLAMTTLMIFYEFQNENETS